MKYKPVIVVIAYNRPRSLERLLSSLNNAKKISDVKLIISIDNKAPDNFIVRDIANEFEWLYGEKEVIYQEKRRGLKKHVLSCGDFASTYGSVIILEDDLFVSPYFYDYAVQSLDYYGDAKEIAGISLFCQPYEEMKQLPFSPINDDSDIFFLQFPSSLGQAWTKDQWEKFKAWFDDNPDITKISIHKNVMLWPETSWKKYFCAYLVEKNKYFVFPRISLSTNFNDPGTHLLYMDNHDGQVPLRIFDTAYRFKKIQDSYCIYDSCHELLPEKVKYLCPQLEEYSFDMDLYGLKDISNIKTTYIITSKHVKNHLWSYKRAMKPHEMNVIFDLRGGGDDLSFCRKEDVKITEESTKDRLSEFEYFYTSFLRGYKFIFYKYLLKFKIFRFFFG